MGPSSYCGSSASGLVYSNAPQCVKEVCMDQWQTLCNKLPLPLKYLKTVSGYSKGALDHTTAEEQPGAPKAFRVEQLTHI
jgi:hypothetical protein